MSDATQPLEHGDGDPDDPWDRGRSGYSLANNRELVFACLDAAGARSVVEIGAEHGLFTRELLAWAGGGDAAVTAIDPSPHEMLVELAAGEPRLELIERTSTEALAELPRFDAYIVDGDHNYFTVSAELRAIEAVAQGPMPLVLFHDVCWPHARRDAYYAPERIPAEHRQPLAENVRVLPWDRGVGEDAGFPGPCIAAREGGPRNGVLTAIEDYLDGREGLRFARVPAFFGFAALWSERTPGAAAIAAVVEPLAEHPVIARLEANRIIHLIERMRAEAHINRGELEKLAWLESELRPMLDSRALALAERVSSLRSSRPAVSRERLREILDWSY